MNTNYDNEATQYQGADNEATQFEETSTVEQTNENDTPKDEAQVKASEGGWKKTAISAGTGLLIGGASTLLMGMKNPDTDTELENISNNHKDELSHPEWVDDEVQVATTVNDDMSFGEAFAAARAEVGPGGCFEWHGQIYGTYTAEEWNSMTAEQRAEFGDHFSWNHIDHSSSDVAQHSTTSHSNNSVHVETPANNDDDIEIVSVNHNEGHNEITQNNIHNTTQTDVVDSADPEIEILGVVHDSESGANIGGMTVDGQEVIVIDVDGDMTFDYMASDLNGNGQIDENELVDIQNQGLTVSDFGGITNPTGDMIASNDAPDYSTDAVYES